MAEDRPPSARAATAAAAAEARALNRRQRQVRRHSLVVRGMKILLPVGALVLVALIFMQGRERGSIEDLFTAEELARLGAGLRLEQPRFAGLTDGGDPYVVTADWALPDQAMPEEIALERPRGEIRLDDGREVTATAATGLMRRSAQTLTLTGDVVILSTEGQRIETDELLIDFGQKRASTPGPVRGSGPEGSIEAGRFHAEAGEGGLSDAHIWFENRVRVLFIPSRDG